MRKANGSQLILVVDEDVDACDIMSHALSFLGYQPLCVTNPADALRLSAQRAYAAAFVELVMPGLTGFDLFHALRRTTVNSRTPAVAMSAFHEYRHRALQVGFSAFVNKPIEVVKLRPVLQQLVPLTH
jgi:CheY-like chemotaxis protein